MVPTCFYRIVTGDWFNNAKAAKANAKVDA